MSDQNQPPSNQNNQPSGSNPTTQNPPAQTPTQSPPASSSTQTSPAQTQPTQPNQQPASPPNQNPPKVIGKVLLLVEDDPLLINMYQTKFSSEGFEVFTATDGRTGLALAKSENPDIIILDIMMPKMDGIEVLRNIRQDPKLSSIPVLILSNLSEVNKQKEAKELGAKEFLVKANLTPTQVVEKIKQHLGQ